ncbi:MAG: M28 family peptidase [Acidimicrobiia bacterium]|nr:M28 family peptidase [Acidimicrobiia bacterium]
MTPIDRMRRVVEALCAPALAGRAAGSPGGAAARAMLVEAFTASGLEPRGEHGYLQLLPAMAGANVLGAIPGKAPGWVVFGAHYDHLGEISGTIHPGADDNAAGVAVLVEVAGRLARETRRGRSILVCAFDAEEPPWFDSPDMGSQWWVDHPTVPLSDVELMICLDLVGHDIGTADTPTEVAATIFVAGADLAPGLVPAVHVPDIAGIVPRPIADWVVTPLSDHLAFRAAGIPHLFYTGGRSAVYHSPHDRPELLDHSRMAALADHLTALIDAACTAPPRSWRFDREGSDDAATVATLLSLVDAVPAPDLIAEAIAALEGMQGIARLDDDDRAWIRALVDAVESMLR